jgi:putative ABC transport system permease protein
MARRPRLPVTFYRLLVRSLPRSAREGFEEDMVEAFARAWARSVRKSERARILARSFADVVRCTFREWRRVSKSNSISRLGQREKPKHRLEKTMSSVSHDIRYAIRQFKNRPGFAVIVVLVLGLGIGATTAVFTVVNGVLLKPLPYHDPERLVLLWGHMSATEVTKAPWSGPDLVDFRARAQAFESFGAASGFNATLTGDFEPEPIQLGWATSNFFDLLGIEPALGRRFEPSDEQNLDPRLFAPGSSPPPGVAMLSFELWERRFGRDPGVIGRTVRVAGQPMEIVGVVPRAFQLFLPAGAAMPSTIDVWSVIPFDLSKGPRDAQWLTVIGRLAPGIEPLEARAEMTALAAQLRAENQFHANVGMEIDVVPMRDDVVGHTAPVLYALLGAVGFVLLIACANVANLHLVRAQGRSRELAIRSAIGGSRSRIVRQMLIESVVLAIAGGVVGLGLARAGIDLLIALRPENLPRVESVSIDLRVLLFAFIATLVSALLFGVFPAIQSSRQEPSASLQDRSAGLARSGRSHRVRDALVVSEVAVALLLLIGSGLMIRTFFELTRVDPGFLANDVLTTNVALPFLGSKGADERLDFHLSLRDQLATLPGVQAVGALTPLPLGGGGQFWFGPYALHEASDEEWSRNEVDYRAALPGFLDAIGTKLLAGRAIDERDSRSDAPRRVMVDETLAAEAWPSQNPLGKRIMVMRPNNEGQFERYWAEVIGVTEHVRYDDIRRDGRGTIYFPFTDWYFTDLNYVIRTSSGAVGLAETIRNTIRNADPDIPAAPVVPLANLLDRALAPTRFAFIVMTVFAAVALCLALVGLYGVLSYMVRDRSQELAVRIAFGAERKNILALIVNRGLFLTLVGVACGLVAAAILTRSLRTLLFGVTAMDPVTYAVIATVLTAVALFACYVPARRATQLDPIEALRAD